MNYTETVTTSILGILLIFLTYLHLGPYAHGMFAMATGVIVLVVFGLYFVFIWNEFPHDEREAALQNKSDRFGFLIASFVLIVSIIFLYIQGANDSHLLFALLALLIGKFIASLYIRRTH
jgi:O-antigen/teichoic acid export membrane protein